jgi:SWI/SNF-related matrix-associated actin-dependent regulator 1 of chromatin subfamily A
MEFARKFCKGYYAPWGFVVTGASNLSSLHDLIYGNYLVRRVKEDVLDQLPEKIRQVVELDEVELEESDSVLDMFNTNAVLKSADSMFIEFMETVFEETQKVIVFAHHKAMMDSVQAICEKTKSKFIRIDGAVPATKRFELVEKFQNNAEIKVAILSITAASTGIDLTAANVVIFAELYWEPGTMQQAEDRTHRIGQKNAVLILIPTLTRFERRVQEMLLEKVGIIKRVMDGGIDDSIKDTDLMKSLAEEFSIPIRK